LKLHKAAQADGNGLKPLPARVVEPSLARLAEIQLQASSTLGDFTSPNSALVARCWTSTNNPALCLMAYCSCNRLENMNGRLPSINTHLFR
jgi:hypothetical protein